MNTRNLYVLITVLIAGLLVCVSVLVYQHLQLTSLRDQLAEHATHIYQIEKALRIKEANRISINLPRPPSLASGIYTLAVEVAADPLEDEKSEYTISHFVLDIEANSVKRKLQFGYARSGIFAHIFYFDYNSDGKVDTNMMHDYAESIPFFGKVLSWSIDPELSQSLYDAFLENTAKAEYLSLDEIATEAEESAKDTWLWLHEASADLTKWVVSGVGD